jgi:hypothetical protein
MLEDLNQRLGSILLSSSLHIVGKSVQGTVTVLSCLELNNLVGVTPLVDLQDLVLVLLAEKVSTLLLGANIHNEESNDIRGRCLRSGRGNTFRGMGRAISGS